MLRIRKYWPFQREMHEFATRHAGEDFGIEGPTGCGKTTVITGVVADSAKTGIYRGVLIATTQEQIEDRFVRRDFEKIRFGRRVLFVPHDLIPAARDAGTTRARVSEFLKGKESHAMACTHAALATMDTRRLPRRLKGWLLILDEGHHSAADGLSRFVEAWRRRGGTVAHFTATGYRSDGRQVGTDETAWFRRSLAQHMEEGYAPRHLRSQVRPVKSLTDRRVTYEQFTGSRDAHEAYIGDIVKEAVRTWGQLGRPKTFFRFPPMAGGSGLSIKALEKALLRKTKRVVNGYGSDPATKREFLRVLREESRRSFRSSKVDAILGVSRVGEGTDWVHCECVINVGLPGSVVQTVHLMGRAVRLKDKTCPRRRRDVAHIVFLVPTTGRELTDELATNHSRSVLVQSCFMADSQSGQRWLLERELRRMRVHPRVADDGERSRIQLVVADARRRAEADGRQLTVREALREVREAVPDADESTAKSVVAEMLLRSSSGEQARRRLRSIGRSGLATGLPDDLLRILNELLPEFRDATLDGEDSAAHLLRQTHGLTGGDMGAWKDRLVGRILTEEQILEWADAHHRRHQRR